MEPLWAPHVSLCRPHTSSPTLGGMLITAFLAAGGSEFASFLAGLLLGASISFLLGPALRSWLAYREWTDASRQARLTDEILARMQRDSGRRERADSAGTWPPSP